MKLKPQLQGVSYPKGFVSSLIACLQLNWSHNYYFLNKLLINLSTYKGEITGLGQYQLIIGSVNVGWLPLSYLTHDDFGARDDTLKGRDKKDLVRWLRSLFFCKRVTLTFAVSLSKSIVSRQPNHDKRVYKGARRTGLLTANKNWLQLAFRTIL